MVFLGQQRAYHRQQPMNHNRNFFPRQRFDYPLSRSSFQVRQHGQSQWSNLASKGVTGLSKTLTNVQQVLHVIQSTAPIIQEYGPMIKNLPAMYRMMKAFKDIEEVEKVEKVEDKREEVKEQKGKKDGQELKVDTFTSNQEKRELEKEKKSEGISRPKLYI